MQSIVELSGPPSPRLVWLRLQVRPSVVTDRVKVTVPMNPLTGVTVMLDGPVLPARTVTLVGFADMMKSCWLLTATVTVAE